MASGYRKFTRPQWFEVAAFIKTITEDDTPGPDGVKYIRYVDGWDDHKVAEKYKHFPACHSKTVGALRLEIVGRLKPVANGSVNESFRAEVDDLRRRVAALEQWAHERPVKPYVGVK